MTSFERLSTADFIQRCKDCPAPNAALMHAHFGLGIESIVNNKPEEAAEYFQKCIDGRQYLFMAYWQSKVMLAHQGDWPKWIERRQEVVAAIEREEAK